MKRRRRLDGAHRGREIVRDPDGPVSFTRPHMRLEPMPLPAAASARARTEPSMGFGDMARTGAA
jgi:hypothetical protein